jgi:hypothetical protein
MNNYNYDDNYPILFSFLGSIAVYIIISIIVVNAWKMTVRNGDPALIRVSPGKILLTYFMFSTGGGMAVSFIWYFVSKGWFV